MISSSFDYITAAKELDSFIQHSSGPVTVLIHKNADGDCISAGLALSLWLPDKYNIKIVSPNRYSDSFSWLPNSINMLIYDSLFKEAIVDHLKASNIVFCVDFSQRCRTDETLAVLLEGKKVFIIDHHPEEPDIIGKTCINSSAASTCEILYELFSIIDKSSITDDIAKCLYSGILTDTSKFSTANMTHRVHEIAGEIIKDHSIDVNDVQRLIYCNNRLARMRFLGHVLNKCLKIVPGHKVSYITISREDISRFYLHAGDTDGIVNYGLSLKDIKLTAMFKEKKDGIYISFRSVGDFAANELAKQHFNGGGHKNASGGFSTKSLIETVNDFVNIVKSIPSLHDETKQ